MSDLQKYLIRLAKDFWLKNQTQVLPSYSEEAFLAGISQAEKAIRLDERGSVAREAAMDCGHDKQRDLEQAWNDEADAAEAELAALIGETGKDGIGRDPRGIDDDPSKDSWRKK